LGHRPSAFQLLEAEFIVVLHLLQLLLHLRQGELQALDLTREGTNGVLELLDANRELRLLFALGEDQFGGKDAGDEDDGEGSEPPRRPLW